MKSRPFLQRGGFGVLELIDAQTVTDGLRNNLQILNQNECKITLRNAQRTEIREYLNLLDLTAKIPFVFIIVGI